MRRFRALFLFSISLIVFAVAAFLLLHSSTARAATPASGTLSLTSAPLQWNGFATPAASPQGETTCVEGVNCDTFTFTLAPGDYTGKRVRFRITWTNQLNDYDVYAHAGSNAGPEMQSAGDSAPEFVEENTFDINTVVTAGVNDVYTIHTVYWAVATIDPYHGVVSLETIGSFSQRTATHIVGKKSGIRFSRNRSLWATGAGQDAEPSVRVDYQGNAYVGAIRGLTGGNDLWRFDLNPLSPTYDPFLRTATPSFDANGNVTNPAWKGQPDAFSPDDEADLGGDGGGDFDMAVGFGTPLLGTPGAPPWLATTSLTAANVSTQRSADRGENFLRNPAGNVTVPVDDREWQEFLGNNVVYMGYRELAGLQATAKFFINRSDDGGLTYGPAVMASLGGNTTGNITVDQHDGTVYFCFQGPGTSGNKEVRVAAGTPPTLLVAPVSYNTYIAATGQNSIANLFPACKVADDGTLYVTYSDGGAGIWLAHSFDHGHTWAAPVRVDDRTIQPAVKLMPWVVVGKRPGSVAVVWISAEAPDSEDGLGQNNDAANWKVQFAQSLNASSSSPTFYQNTASDHFIHGANVSVAGLVLNGQSPNRNLLDFIQLALDPQGLAFIAFGDDHNDSRGHTYVTHQLAGLNLDAGKRVEIKDTDPGDAVNPADPEVKDWRHDARAEMRPPILPDIDTPADITSINYGCPTQGSVLMVEATMKLSGLTAVPPLGVWRMQFASNPTKPGVSDRADMWYLIAETDAQGVQTFSYGTAARNTDGSTSFTPRGAADFGRLDLVNKTVTVRVALAKLNALQTRGVITDRTKFIGLRGFSSVAYFVIPVETPAASTSVTTGLTDGTRGGTSFSCR